MSKRLPQPFEYRDAWRANVKLGSGVRKTKDFNSHAQAKAWIADMLANANEAHQALLGTRFICDPWSIATAPLFNLPRPVTHQPLQRTVRRQVRHAMRIRQCQHQPIECQCRGAGGARHAGQVG